MRILLLLVLVTISSIVYSQKHSSNGVVCHITVGDMSTVTMDANLNDSLRARYKGKITWDSKIYSHPDGPGTGRTWVYECIYKFASKELERDADKYIVLYFRRHVPPNVYGTETK